MEKRERFDIMVSKTTSQDQISSYLVKATLSLRDRENLTESVRLFGSGSAIPIVILMNEILRTRFTNLSSIITLENMSKTFQDDGQNQTIDIPAIRIKLTLKPTEDDKQQSGYQGPSDPQANNHIELFDYVMVYAKNLYFWSTKNKRPNQNNRPQSQQHDGDGQQRDRKDQQQQSQYQEKREGDNLRTRDQAPKYEKRPQQQDYKRTPQQNEEEQRPYQKRQFQTRGGPRGGPRPRQYQDRQNDRQQVEQVRGTENIQRGEVKTRGTRGGNRKPEQQ